MSEQPRTRPRVAVLGTGIMGSAMVERLRDRDCAVDVWNRSAAPLQPLVSRGAVAHGTAAEAAGAAPVVITMLSTADVVEAVMIEQGTLDAVPSGGAWVQMGTIGVRATERLAALAAERRPDVSFVDAPVSGTRQPARAGQLVILASGPDAAQPLLQPVFDALGRRTLWLGVAGNGSRLKLVLNVWLAFEVEAAAEALALAEWLGVPVATLTDTMSSSPLASDFARVKLAKMAGGDLSADFPLSWAVKDIDLALGEVGSQPLPVAAAIAQRWQQLSDGGLGRNDVSAAHAGLERAQEKTHA